MVTKDNLIVLKMQQVSIADQVENHLTKAYGMDHNVPLVTSELVPLIKVELQARIMQTGMPEFDAAIHGFETMHIEFSKLTLTKFYEIQQAAVAEIRLRENVVAYQETKQQRKAK